MCEGDKPQTCSSIIATIGERNLNFGLYRKVALNQGVFREMVEVWKQRIRDNLPS